MGNTSLSGSKGGQCKGVVWDVWFLPHLQLLYEIRGGTEPAVHAARPYLANVSPGSALVKLHVDFRNAFNLIQWDRCYKLYWISALHCSFCFFGILICLFSILEWHVPFLWEWSTAGRSFGPSFSALQFSFISLLQSGFCLFYLDYGTFDSIV